METLPKYLTSGLTLILIKGDTMTLADKLTLAERYFLLVSSYRMRTGTLDELTAFRKKHMIADGFCDSPVTGWRSESMMFCDGSIFGSSKNTWKNDDWLTSYFIF